jgi:hypothetical protein
MLFQDQLNIAFSSLNQVTTCKKIAISELENEGITKKYVEAWSVELELRPEVALTISIYFAFENGFPNTFPQIYISKQERNKLGFIPHLNSDGVLCTFNTVSARTDPSRSAGIVHALYKKARQIIIDGLDNPDELSYWNEFKAYWEGTYEPETAPTSFLYLFDDVPEVGELLSSHRIIFSEEYKPYLIHDSGSKALTFLKNVIYKPNENINILYVGDINFSKPPYSMTYEDALGVINRYFPESKGKIRKQINDDINILLASKDTSKGKIFIGWTFEQVKNQIKGWRTMSNIEALKFKSNKDKNVLRFSTENIDEDRLLKRSAGFIDSLYKKYALLGCGSIGSNLIHLVSSTGYSDLLFIDNEKLKVENLGRHLLGPAYLSMNKAKGLQKYFTNR